MLLATTLLLAQSWTTILPTDTKVLKVGRFDAPHPGEQSCSWSGSTVAVKTNGNQLKVALENNGPNDLEVLIDDHDRGVLRLHQGSNTYTLDLPPQGPHVVRLIKRTEAGLNSITFKSLSGNGTFSSLSPKKHLIQLVGDSITCGFGNEGKKETDPWKPETENAAQTYGMIAARSVGAEAELIAWSGRKMWPDNTTPSVYDFIHPEISNGPKVDFTRARKPDAVLINLATNDFGKDNPDEHGWCGAYEDFIRKLNQLYPKAHIYCAAGSMMSDNWPPKHQALTTLRRYLNRIVKDMHDPRVGFIEFEPQRMEDGIGAAWHPNIVTHTKMAAVLAARLKKDLRW